MNLFPVNKKPAGEEPIRSNSKSMDRSVPQEACFASQSSEPKSSELTIFYVGQVIVFNDFPAHKAKEIMELDSRGVSQTSTNNTHVVNTTNTNNTITTKNTVDKTTSIPPSSAQQSTTTYITDLPCARKASLHRFLDKRKDRIKARAPYNTRKAGDDVPLKADEGNSWLGLAAAPPS